MKNLCFVLALLFYTNLLAQPGYPDFSFGIGSVANGPFVSPSNAAYDVYQQFDGKLLVAGTISWNQDDDFFLLRYDTNGLPDSTFGVNGQVSGVIGSGADQAFAIAQQADSKILLVGSYDNPIERDVFIRRYDSTGVLDTSFAQGGMVTTDFLNNSDDGALDVHIQPDGKFIICGSTLSSVTFDGDFMLLRYNADGTLDSTFGTGGKVSFDIGGLDQAFVQSSLQPDGKIITVGVTEDVNSYWDVLAMRFMPNGSLDSTFNNDGIYTYDLAGDDDEGWSVALQPDGKILIGGLGITINGDEDDLLIRLDSLGFLDPSFNSTGIVVHDHGQSDFITRVLLQPDGKIITVGQADVFGTMISLTRYLSNGTIDLTFGSTGSIFTMVGNNGSYANSAILQTDNKIVVTGSYGTTNGEDIFTQRYLNDTISTSVNNLISSETAIYPSPAMDKLYLKHFHQGVLIKVFDAQGRIVINEVLLGNSVDVSNLESGIYLLMASSKNQKLFVKKFMKQ